MMQRFRTLRLMSSLLCAGLVLAAQPSAAASADNATAAEAESRLKAIVALFKAKGPAAAQEIMSADDPMKCRYKDLVCMVVDVSDDTIVVQTALPRLVGQKMDYEMADPDGVKIGDVLAGPAKRGTAKSWEGRWKFSRPDTKKITARWATCAKAEPSRAVCVSINQP